MARVRQQSIVLDPVQIHHIFMKWPEMVSFEKKSIPFDDHRSLKILIDSPDVAVWENLLPSGIFYGVTTNPKLLAQSDEPCTVLNLARLAKAAFKCGANEIHLQVWGTEPSEMLEIGRQLASIDSRVMVKVPATRPGYQTSKILVAEGVNVTLTAMHSAEQVLAAIALRVRYAVPYLGRMSDANKDAVAEVIAMQEILDCHPGPTQILLASIRHMDQVTQLARHGISVFTLLPPLAEALVDNPLSKKAAQDFEDSLSKLNIS
jgi:transaldolase